MGRPLVDRLRGAGFDVTAFARRHEARQDLESAGIRCVDDVTYLSPRSDAVLVYVYSDDQVREVVLDSGLADSIEPGTVVVVHTTASPRTMETLNDRLALREASLVDAPGSGGPAEMASGSLTLFVGGTDEHVDWCRPLFASFAHNVVHFGAVGSGQKVKLLNNLLFGAHVELALLASDLSEAFGVDPSLMAKTLQTCSGASYALNLIAAMGSLEATVKGVGPFVHKDVLVARAAADEAGADLGMLGIVSDAILERTRNVGGLPESGSETATERQR
jgi:3-hydroxyisobutyrate dehydrogenase-like beta-hydroxyacid dehydrogenase